MDAQEAASLASSMCDKYIVGSAEAGTMLAAVDGLISPALIEGAAFELRRSGYGEERALSVDDTHRYDAVEILRVAILAELIHRSGGERRSSIQGISSSCR